MTQHAHPLEFGYFLPPTAGDYPELLAQVRLCEELGLEWIGIQDHPYQARHLDTWTLLSALAAQASALRFFPNVANLALRPPAILARSAASLDQITGGRIELGLGAGFYWDGIAALGGPRRSPGEAVDALAEAIQVIRLMWSGGRGLRFEGQHYQLSGAHAGPDPAHPIGIWLGAIQSRMLALTGAHCDGWVPSSPYVPADQLLDKHRQIDEAAQAAGRDPASVRRVYNLMGSITETAGEGYLQGPVQLWVDELSLLASERRMDLLIFAPNQPSQDQIRLFAEQVVPRVRANLAG
jgi:alkanesulfonate monooxygenase SsuD/methylene tetrahydromethanopterin reductase-like flavin-dependent oxidoreductase (luciferase family)